MERVRCERADEKTRLKEPICTGSEISFSMLVLSCQTWPMSLLLFKAHLHLVPWTGVAKLKPPRSLKTHLRSEHM